MNFLFPYQPGERLLLHITTNAGRSYDMAITHFGWLILVRISWRYNKFKAVKKHFVHGRYL